MLNISLCDNKNQH